MNSEIAKQRLSEVVRIDTITRIKVRTHFRQWNKRIRC